MPASDTGWFAELRRITFWSSVGLCAFASSCSAVLVTIGEGPADADVRARETARLVRSVHATALKAEGLYQLLGRVPTREELNGVTQCKPFGCRKRAWLDDDGVLHVEDSTLGVPFTPARQYTVEWNAKSRRSTHDFLVEPWQWHVRYALLLAACALVATLPWWPRLVRAGIRRLRN